MSDLTEIEILERMRSSLREAIQCANILAISPRKGPTYNKLREHLGLVEGCCRQMSAWREDTRWLPIGRLMAECHQKAGNWLRGYKTEAGVRIYYGPSMQNPLFLMLEANLKALYALAEQTRSAKTGKLGAILPVAPAYTRPIGAPSRVMLPPGMTQTKTGLLVPTKKRA